MKFFTMVFHNWGFWLSTMIVIVYGLYRFLVTKSFNWIEYLVFTGGSFVLSLLLYLILFTTVTDTFDTEIHAGFVQHATYEEGYTYEYYVPVSYPCGTDSKGNTTYCTRMERRTSYKPPQWSISTDVGGRWISSAEYAGYYNYWGAEYKVGNHHSDQVSSGDGRTYQVPSRPDKRIYANATSEYINYVRASFKTILKNQGVKDRYVGKLVDYPSPYNSGFGPINLNRVLVSPGTQVPADWLKKMNWDLNMISGELGPVKQVCPIIILTDQDEGYVEGMREHWMNGKKNDSTIYIGVKHFPNIDWVNVQAWTDHEDYKIDLRNSILDIKTLDRGPDIINTINKTTIHKFKRKSMKDFEYLLGDITLPMWAQLLVFALQAAAAFWLVLWFEREDPFDVEFGTPSDSYSRYR